jgi:hypothetical protein
MVSFMTSAVATAAAEMFFAFNKAEETAHIENMYGNE